MSYEDKAPREVRWLVHVLLAWSPAVATFWIAIAFVAFATSAHFLLWMAALAIGIGVAGVVVPTAWAMCDRGERGMQRRFRWVRACLGIHHVTLLVAGTTALVLLLLSNQYFWNGAQDHRSDQLVLFAILYGALVIVPSLAGVWLELGLRKVARRYVDGAVQPIGT